MLNDVLGTIVAFMTIIVLLSILVTGLVQASQALLGLRGRNLLWGVTRLIQTFDGGTRRGWDLSKRDAKGQATEVLNDPGVALIYHVSDPLNGKGRLWRLMRGPGVSWVDPEALAQTIVKQTSGESRRSLGPENRVGQQRSEPSDNGMATPPTTDETPAKIEETKASIARMDVQLSKRFTLQMRVLSLAWAAAVAVGFQVSAPKLLVELSQDSVRRERILAESRVLLAREEQTLAVLHSEDSSKDAIAELSARFPRYARQFEELSGVGTTREFLLDELRLVLGDAPDRDQIVKVYGEMLDASGAARLQAVSAELGATLDTLGGFDIRFWRDKNYFIGEKVHWDAIVGVLLTIVLLSFGAPFWFERLREAASLRDRLAPSTQTTQASKHSKSKDGTS